MQQLPYPCKLHGAYMHAESKQLVECVAEQEGFVFVIPVRVLLCTYQGMAMNT